MAQHYDINTFDDLLSWLGGQKGARKRFGLSQPAISHWRARGIPSGYHLRLYLEIRMEGLTINPDLFEIDGPLGDVMNRRDFPLPAAAQ